ncbi:LONGIFOLIA 1-like protein [Drosera capensis]
MPRAPPTPQFPQTQNFQHKIHNRKTQLHSKTHGNTLCFTTLNPNLKHHKDISKQSKSIIVCFNAMTTTGIIHDPNSLEKHIQKNMGCMAGFFNLSGLLPGKRFSPKRLPSSSPFDSSSDAATAVSSVSSPAFSSELSKPTPQQKQTITPNPKPRTPTAEKEKSKSESSRVVVAKASTSPWKFSRDAPRLSLDSRFVVDAKGSLYPREIRTTKYDSNDGEKQRPASPSVIARLMGLEATTPTEPERKVELRRSASESRSRDLIDQYQFLDSNTFVRESNRIDQITQKLNASKAMLNHHYQAASEHPNGVFFGTVKTDKMTPRSRFDSADFLPKRNPLPMTTASVFGEIEKRLRMSGIEESSRDLETLKQILDAIHLKGLLHSTPLSNSKQKQNFVFNDRRYLDTSSPIVVMKPAKSRPPNESLKPVNRRNSNLGAESAPVRRERNNRSGGSAAVPAAAARRRPAEMRVETGRREREASSSPVQSPRVRRGMDRTAGGSPRRTISTAEICRREKARGGGEDEVVSIVSESSYSSCSHGDGERWKPEEPSREGGGRTLLERCDKLLHSIAAMTSTKTTVAATDDAVCINSIATELQPSPISVLDSSFNKDDDEELPSPVMKRTIDFEEELVEQEEHEMLWSPSSSATAFNREQDSSDLSYISDVLRASNYLHSSDVDRFLFLEKQQLLKGEDVSKSSLIRRRLIFDTITETLDRGQRIPPWNPTSPARNLVSKKPSLSEIWSEFQRIQDPGPTNDLFDTICGVLKKDLTQDSISGWGNYSVEISDTVLDIERLIFKDLIGETIRDLASFSGNNATAPCRKLLF